MKKLAVLVTVMMMSFSMFSQRERTILDIGSFKTVSWSLVKTVNTNFYESVQVEINWRDMTYHYITRMGGLLYTSEEDLESFIKDLEIICNYKGNGHMRAGYVSTIMNNKIRVNDKDDAYVYISKKNARKLIIELKRIKSNIYCTYY